MCGLCGVLGAGEHWADQPRDANPAEAAARRRGDRMARVRLMNQVLHHYRLRLDDWQGSAFLLSSRTGRTEIVDSLASLWPAAARMTSARLDPLDPDLIDGLDHAAE